MLEGIPLALLVFFSGCIIGLIAAIIAVFLNSFSKLEKEIEAIKHLKYEINSKLVKLDFIINLIERLDRTIERIEENVLYELRQQTKEEKVEL